MEYTRAEIRHETKSTFYGNLCEQVLALLGSETNTVANAANTAALLFQALPDVNWVGFYLVDEGELVLGPFQGKPACVRIPFGKGVCGTAAEQQKTIIVHDVDAFPGHIRCDADSRSEIVIPLLNWGNLVGVLDIDSTSLNRFDDDDVDGLESVASIFLASHVSDHLPDFSDEVFASL